SSAARRGGAQYGQWSIGPRLRDGADLPIGSAKSCVQVAGTVAYPPTACPLPPVPTSRYVGLRMFSQCPVLAIQPFTTGRGAANPVRMSSPAENRRKRRARV